MNYTLEDMRPGLFQLERSVRDDRDTALSRNVSRRPAGRPAHDVLPGRPFRLSATDHPFLMPPILAGSQVVPARDFGLFLFRKGI